MGLRRKTRKNQVSNMKSSFAILLAAALSAEAAIVQFGLSPAGRDNAVGLSPSNVVPPAIGSTGSGNEISGGISLDTNSQLLSIALGYGSAAGFTDLTGAATGAHIHGPAGPGTNADVLIDLSPVIFLASDPAKGGVIVANITLNPIEVSNLLSGLCYIDVTTSAFTNGELRGQLVSVSTNAGPSVICPSATVIPCNVPAELTAIVSDPTGDALTVIWSVNGISVQTNQVPAALPSVVSNVSFNSSLPFGTNAIGVLVMNTSSNSASCDTTVTVIDTNPPVIVSVSADPSTLWPANHKLIPVRVNANVTDDCTATTWKIISVTSNEAVNGKGSGNTSSDWEICGDHVVKLRAERAGNGSGRVYTITIQATDEAGNVSVPATVTVSVPHDVGQGRGNNRNGSQGNENSQGNDNSHGKGNGHGKGKGNSKH